MGAKALRDGWVRPGRALHLIDIENLLGNPFAERDEALATIDTYLAAAGWKLDDHVRIAANGWLAQQIMWDLVERGLPHRLHSASGPDGADLALLEGVDARYLQRFDRVVIGSGDGIFAEAAGIAAGRGTDVLVLAGRGHVSASLRLIAHRVAHLPAAAPRLPVGRRAVGAGR